MLHMIGHTALGLLIDLIAKLLMPGTDPGGWIVTALLGLGGGRAGGWIGRMLGWYKEGQAAGFGLSVAGAMRLLLVYRFVF
jgi:uncharacterized membrane protein YeaQ/YmgE (transglycosylase-associated protein family)